MKISKKDIKLIEDSMVTIAQLGAKLGREPIDPKVEMTLELLYNLLEEQLVMNKHYTWREVPSPDDKFMRSEDTPSVDDLNSYFDLGEEVT